MALVGEYSRDQLADVHFVINDEDVGRHDYPSLAAFCSSVLPAALTGASAWKRRRTQAPRAPGIFSDASRSSIVPPWSSRIRPTIASPRPVPFSRVVT